jgi:hypothetical protein
MPHRIDERPPSGTPAQYPVSTAEFPINCENSGKYAVRRQKPAKIRLVDEQLILKFPWSV